MRIKVFDFCWAAIIQRWEAYKDNFVIILNILLNNNDDDNNNNNNINNNKNKFINLISISSYTKELYNIALQIYW